MQIIPSILESTFDGFVSKLKKVEAFFPFVQIDVMDGKFVEAKSFAEVERVKEIETNLRYELHLMVQDPIAEMEKWKDNTKVFRVIFPIEDGDPSEAIAYARAGGWQVGLVLNPDTKLSAVEPYFALVDLILFMTVYPGKQGQPFVNSVKEKIAQFNKLPTRPLGAVDGAVNKTNVHELQALGVDIVYPGSALCGASDVKKALHEMQEILKN